MSAVSMSEVSSLVGKSEATGEEGEVLKGIWMHGGRVAVAVVVVMVMVDGLGEGVLGWPHLCLSSSSMVTRASFCSRIFSISARMVPSRSMSSRDFSRSETKPKR